MMGRIYEGRWKVMDRLHMGRLHAYGKVGGEVKNTCRKGKLRVKMYVGK